MNNQNESTYLQPKQQSLSLHLTLQRYRKNIKKPNFFKYFFLYNMIFSLHYEDFFVWLIFHPIHIRLLVY